MFRKPTSTMTAVEIVSCMFDGPIPADIMIQARAEDQRSAAENPDYRPAVPSALEETRMMVAYYADKIRSMIEAKRNSDAAGVPNSAWTPTALRSWLCAWRQERRQLARLLARGSHAS